MSDSLEETLKLLCEKDPQAALILAAFITQEVADIIVSTPLTIIATQISNEARRIK